MGPLATIIGTDCWKSYIKTLECECFQVGIKNGGEQHLLENFFHERREIAGIPEQIIWFFFFPLKKMEALILYVRCNMQLKRKPKILEKGKLSNTS